MKKFLALSLILGSAIIFTPSESKAAEIGSSAVYHESPQNRYYRQQRINRRGVRVVNRTRIVRRGYATFREVWQTRYLPNGRVQTRLLSRTRIR